MFKFKKENDNFIWENGYYKLEYSEPSIHAFDDYIEIDSLEQAMYSYYVIKLYQKSDKRQEYQLISKRRTYDFPCIVELKWIIEYYLDSNNDIRTDGQRIEYRDGQIKYLHTMCSEGFACDDNYVITKRVDKNNTNPVYCVYIGTSNDFNGDMNSSGFALRYISEEELKELLKCVDSFIQFSLESHNNNEYANQFKIQNNRLYQYDGKQNYIDGKIDLIYKAADVFHNIIYVRDNKQYELNDCKVLKINEDSIQTTQGVILLSELREMYHNYDDIVSYGICQIVEDFKELISEKDLVNFKNMEIKELYDKYGMAILNRSAMCRKEHGFERHKRIEPIEDVKPYVMKAIEIIKTTLK